MINTRIGDVIGEYEVYVSNRAGRPVHLKFQFFVSPSSTRLVPGQELLPSQYPLVCVFPFWIVLTRSLTDTSDLYSRLSVQVLRPQLTFTYR